MFLSFVWASFSHSSCTPHASSFTIVHIFFSFPSSSWFICLFMTKRGRNSTSCTFVRGEIHRGEAYITGEKTFFLRKFLLWENLALPYACSLGVLWCFVFYALLLSSHRVYVLNMHTSLYLFEWSFALLCGHCSHFYMTVLVYDQVALMFHIMFTWS